MINILSNKRGLRIINHLSQWLKTRRPRRTNKGSFIPAQPTRCAISPIASAGRPVLVGVPPQHTLIVRAKAGPIFKRHLLEIDIFVVTTYILNTYVNKIS